MCLYVPSFLRSVSGFLSDAEDSVAPDLQGLASLIVAQPDLLPSFRDFPGMLWLLLGILDHSRHEAAVSISFVCLRGVAAAASQLQPVEKVREC